MNKQASSLSERARKRTFLRRLAKVIKWLAGRKKQAPKSQERTEQE